jgi:hypothetical protein
MPKQNDYFKPQDVRKILSGGRIKKPIQLSLEEIAENLNCIFANYISLSREEVQSKLEKAKEKRKRVMAKLQKIQKELSTLRQKHLPELERIGYDDYHFYWLLTVKARFDNLENYISFTCKKLARARGRPPGQYHSDYDENIQGLIFDLGLLYIDITGRKPGMSEGPFTRFVHECLLHVGTDRDKRVKLERQIRSVLDGSYIKRILGSGEIPE